MPCGKNLSAASKTGLVVLAKSVETGSSSLLPAYAAGEYSCSVVRVQTTGWVGTCRNDSAKDSRSWPMAANDRSKRFVVDSQNRRQIERFGMI